MNKLKKTVKNLLVRNKVRLVLYLIQTPVSYVIIRLSGIFDDDWYKLQCNITDRKKMPLSSPLLHYLLAGRRRGYTPHPLFTPEYFDPVNWHRSVVDPLSRYLIDSKNWQLPTSLFFDGGELGKGPSLKNFLRSESPNDRVLGIGLDWKTIRRKLYDNMQNYHAQESMRDKTSPVDGFDLNLEREYIDKFRSTHDKNKPKVSIITPTWNRQEMIVDAIRSVQNQTYTNWEMIVIDDGSTDNTVEVVHEIKKQDSRVRLIEPGRGGVCRARNSGLNEVTGEYVAFLDSDNVWRKDFLQTMIGAMIAEQFDAAYSAIKMDSDGKTRYRTTKPDSSLLRIGNYIDLNALIVKRSTLDKVGLFDENLKRMVDYDLVCRIDRLTDFLYVPIIGVEYTDSNQSNNRITTSQPVSWDGVVKSKNFINITPTGKKRKLSIVLPVTNDLRTAQMSLEGIRSSGDQWQFDYEIIIADSSSSPGVSSSLFGWTLLDSHIKYYRFPASHDNSLGGNYGVEQSTGEYVAVIDQRVVVESYAINLLYKAVHDDPSNIYTPVHLKPSRTIHSAGEVWTSSADKPPIHFLEHHPMYDLDGFDDIYEVPMATTGVYVASKELISKVQGVYPLFSNGFSAQDLSMRLSRLGFNTCVVKQARIVTLDENRDLDELSQNRFVDLWFDEFSDGGVFWDRAGFMVDEYRSDHQTGRLVPILSLKESTNGRYRWAIKISAPADDRRFAWGDLYYAESLKRALESLDQKVAIDFHGYHKRPTSYLDDVLLDIRGLDDVTPQKGAINIMWVISHPEKVTPAMVKRFDKVYSAGQKWSEHMTRVSGYEVETLLQATDTTKFYPARYNDKYRDKILFVGNSRGVKRKIVDDAIRSGLDISVYGAGWEELIDKKYIKGNFIPNDELGEAYGSAKVVLNDHWDDMREWGFISNRIFDAAASGAAVVTDDVYGVDGLSLDSIKPYYSADNLAKLVKESFDNIDTIRSSNVVKEQYSFDSRAKRLLHYVNSKQ